MVQAAKASDLNPDFSFDFASGYAAAQAPWELSGIAELRVKAFAVPMDSLFDTLTAGLQVLQARSCLRSGPTLTIRFSKGYSPASNEEAASTPQR